MELPAKNLALNKAFFSQVFGWGFKDYGPAYKAFENAGLEEGAFRLFGSRPQKGAALVIPLSDDLEAVLNKVKDAGGTIEQEIFEFSGGRFHFLDPCGNEWTVWGHSLQKNSE